MKSFSCLLFRLQLVCVFLLSVSIRAQVRESGSKKIFIEDNKHQWPAQVKYQAEIPGGMVFFENNALTYLLSENIDFHGFSQKTNEAIVLHQHAWKVKFEEANPSVKISGIDPYSFHRNYYRGNDPLKWAENVNVYNGLTYQNLYEGIDVHFYNAGEHFKYDFIIAPGADYKKIKMDYEGADNMRIEYGHLYIKTSLGTVIEQKPYAYQEIEGKKIEVACSYNLKQTKLSFLVKGRYNKSLPLIIDPTLIASTYTGSTGDNWGFTATYDQAGNIYSGGIAAETGYPTTVGAFQTVFAGGGMGGNAYPFDVSITKYNPTGTTILFSTYYGGSDNEQPHSFIVNPAGELYVAGRTYSSDFPVTTGAYDQSHNGGADLFIGKFNSSGGLLSSTFVGGAADDGVNYTTTWSSYAKTKFNYADDGRSEIMLDAQGNVYVAASTQSANFPVSAGAYDANLGGAQDGCVVKMNANLSTLIFGTYLGGSDYDAAYGLKVDNSLNVYVTGGTSSTDFPTTAGVLHGTYLGGLTDGFISVLNSSGTSLTSSTFIGTSQYDQSFFIECDSNNDIYILGQTTGAYPVTAGVYSNPNSAQFIHKMNSSLTTTLMSTVIGTGSANPNISPTAFLVDSCRSIYISGWARCANFLHPNDNTVVGMPITANAQQSTTDGCDFYFMVLTPNAQALWYGSFYGENGGLEPDHVDGGTSRFDSRGFIYQSVCASCGGSQGFPTMPGAWSTSNNSLNCNNAVVKMDMGVKPYALANVTGPNVGCAPFTVQLNNTGSTALHYSWDFGDGSPIDTLSNISHIYTSPGIYTVTLTAIDSLGICKNQDTSTLIIKVGSVPVLQVSHVNVLCAGTSTGSVSVTATGGFLPYTYTWSPLTQVSPTVSGLAAGVYSVVVKDSIGCSSTISDTVKAPPPLLVSVTDTVHVSCYAGHNGSATVSGSGGTGTIVYSWNTIPVTSGTKADSLKAGDYTVTLTDANGCQLSQHIVIHEAPEIIVYSTITPSDCGVKTGSIVSTAAGGTVPYTYLWQTNPVQTGATISNLGAGVYSGTITDSKGCTQTFSYTVPVKLPPVADFDYNPHVVSVIDPLVNFTDLSTGNQLSWAWNFGDAASGIENLSVLQNPLHSYSDTGRYCISLIVTDKNGVCKDTMVKCLLVQAEFTFYIPNAFTPNNDGKNEFFTGYGTYIKDFHLLVFDRWGALIFESNDVNRGWDGKVSGGASGMKVQEDVYLWKVDVSSVYNKQFHLVGRVTVVR